MKQVLYFAFLFCSSFASLVLAQGSLVNISVPAGYKGPLSSSHQSGAQVMGYVKKIPGSERGTLIQISTYDFGAQLSGMPEEMRGETAAYYHDQFLAGVQRQRTSFKSSEITRVVLDGIPSARVEWSGVAQGFKMSGVMYCSVAGTVVVSMHAQGFDDSPDADFEAAVAAIDKVRFNSE